MPRNLMSETPQKQAFLVGELARRCGVSVRTLHHYHAIGLLAPARRSAAGRRLYGEREVVRLFRIRALQQLGLSLDAIAACLSRRQFSPLQLIGSQLERLRRQQADTERLCQRLESLRARLQADADVDVGEFLSTIEAMTMFERYYTKDQMAQLAARRQQLGEAAIAGAQAEWPRLVAAMRTEMERGTDPRSPAVQTLAARWRELLALFTGGDEGIREAAASAYAKKPQLQAQHGLDPALMQYVGRALGGTA